MVRAKVIMLEAIKKKNLTPIGVIVERGFPVNDPLLDCGANLLMHVSATCGRDEVSKILALKPDVNARDNIGRTALHYACRAANQEAFEVLIECIDVEGMEDIDVDAVTNAGVTPLMMAVESADIQLVAFALNQNLNPFLKDALNRTVREYALHYRNLKGHDMLQLIETAMNQWNTQSSEEERFGSQVDYSGHYVEFQQMQE